MARHVGDALLGAVPLGDVLVDRDPAAVRHRLVRHREGAAVGQFLEIGAGALRARSAACCSAQTSAECGNGVSAALAHRSRDHVPGCTTPDASSNSSRKR